MLQNHINGRDTTVNMRQSFALGRYYMVLEHTVAVKDITAAGVMLIWNMLHFSMLHVALKHGAVLHWSTNVASVQYRLNVPTWSLTSILVNWYDVSSFWFLYRCTVIINRMNFNFDIRLLNMNNKRYWKQKNWNQSRISRYEPENPNDSDLSGPSDIGRVDALLKVECLRVQTNLDTLGVLRPEATKWVWTRFRFKFSDWVIWLIDCLNRV